MAKNIFSLTATTACIMMCACNTTPKASDEASPADNSQTPKQHTTTAIDSADIIDKTHQFLQSMNEANEAGDEQKQTSVSQAYQLWYMTLSREEQSLSQEVAFQESVGKY